MSDPFAQLNTSGSACPDDDKAVLRVRYICEGSEDGLSKEEWCSRLEAMVRGDPGQNEEPLPALSVRLRAMRCLHSLSYGITLDNYDGTFEEYLAKMEIVER